LASFIPQEKISEITNRADILDIVSEFVLLKKSGRNYLGLCPFHTEKTPSFTVSPDKQIYYCFGCGEGGDAIRFLMKQEAIAFPEAVKRLAKRYGVEIPSESMDPHQRQQMDEKERLLAVNQAAGEFFQICLSEPNGGKAARDYLVKRGLALETCSLFRLGFAPDEWDRLARFFMKKKIPFALAEKTGLVLPRKQKSGYYDRFRARIVFPICDIGGRIIGFGGRVMDDRIPKYLNSPESPVYHKGKSLYGLNLAKQACRETDSVYIVEGYFDLIALYQAGIKNVVATLGTALSEVHVRTLKGYARKAVLVFDSDTAGVNAARRSIDIFMQAAMEARILVLPTGHDPDTYILSFGGAEFKKLADRASGMMEFLMETAVQKYGLSIEGKLRVLDEMQPPLGSIRDDVARSLYVQALSEKIGVDEKAIMQKVREAIEKSAAHPSRSRPLQSPVESTSSFQSKGIRLERQLIAMMLQFAEMIPEIEKSGVIEGVEDPVLKSIGQAVIRFKDKPISDIVQSFDDRAQQSVAAGLAIETNLWDREGCLKLISQIERMQSRNNDDLLKQIKFAEDEKDDGLLLELLKKRQLRARQGH